MSFNDLEIKVLDDKKTAEILKYYPCYTRGLITIGKKKWCMIRQFLNIGEEIYNFEPRSDDTWIVTFPRSDEIYRYFSSWREMLHCKKVLSSTSGIVETDLFMGKNVDEEQRLENSVKFVEKQLSPRFIKTHISLDLLPTIENSDCKVIYVARNPKDVVVSWYHFQKEIEVIKYKGNFEQFCDIFMSDRTIYCPYWEHVKEGWAKRHRPNTLFIFYEDLVKDLPENIRKIAAFYGKSYNEEQIAKLVDHVSLKKFRENKMVNVPSTGANMNQNIFIRRGIVGDWKAHFTPEIEAKFNKWIADNTKDTDLVFPC